MNRKLKFSVILPIYINVNSRLFIKSFNSILNQSLKPNEIIIIFDGPVKKKITKFLNLKKKKLSSIRFIFFKKNYGLGHVLNYAVKKCKYEYVARCDADDISRKDRFEKQINYMKRHPEIDVLGSNIYEIYNNKIFSKKIMKMNHKDIKKQLVFRNPLNHSSIIFKKKKLIKSGNYKQMFYFEDYYLWFRMIKKGFKFNNLPNFLISMNVDENFYARRKGLEYYKFYLKFLKTLYLENHINIFRLLYCALIRSPIIIINRNILKIIYQKFLRNAQ